MSALRIRPFVFALAALALACSDKSSSGGGDGGTPASDGGSSTAPDAGDGKCRGDEGCPANQYCERSSGACLPAKACRTIDDCILPGPSGEDDYCSYDGCFCDTNRNGGSCRPRFSLCQACSSDLECGADALSYQNYTASCAADKDGSKVCLPLRATGCPTGYVAGAGANCVPGGGSCGAAAPCAKDDDCDPRGERPVCDVVRGFCVPPCVFDYQKGTSDGCPAGQACHVDPRLLTANNPNFGGGKCGPPCEGGAFACPAGTSCETDGDPSIGANKSKRCRPPLPKCIRDADCPPDAASHSKGYCDKGSLACQPGCRRETDCDSGYRCFQNTCTKKTCVENGGANLACALGQFCCGEADSPAPCPTGVSDGACYDAPNPPWCGSCTASADDPGGSVRPQASRCVPTTIAGRVVNLQWHACDTAKRAQCPRGQTCTPLFQFCQDDAACGGQQGSCAEITTGVVAGGRQIEVKAKGCTCDQDTGNGCPAPSTCGCTCKGPNGTCKDPSDPSCVDGEGRPMTGSKKFTGVCMADWCKMDECIASQ